MCHFMCENYVGIFFVGHTHAHRLRKSAHHSVHPQIIFESYFGDGEKGLIHEKFS